MKKISSILPVCFFLLTAFSAFAQDSRQLVLSRQFEAEIKGGERHFYTVEIPQNQTARIEIEQKGVDVSLAASKPNGKVFIESESPSGVLGNDLILVTADEAGAYTIAVTPADPKSAAGKYIVKLTEIRPTVPQDFQINEAAMKITRVGDETAVLRQKGTREGRRQALEKFQEMIALSKIKQDKVWEVVALLSGGFVYEQLGEVQNALNFYTLGLNLAREIGNRQYEGSALNNLAVSSISLGEYEAAIFYLAQAITLQRETGNKRGEAVNLNNFGTAYMLLGDLPKAQGFYQQALVMRREVKDQRGEAVALNNLGQVFRMGKDLPKSVEFLQQALTLQQAIGDKRGEAGTLRNLGITARLAGDHTKATSFFEKSNALANQLGERRVEADTFYYLALSEKEKGNIPKAIETIEGGLRLIEQLRGELINPDLRISYFSTVQQYYELYIELLVLRGEKNKDDNDIALALQMSERARTRSLVELLQEARVNFKRGIDERVFEKQQELQDALNTKYRQRTQLLSGKPTPEQLAKITDEINSLTVETRNLETKLRSENPRYADLTFGISTSAKEIQNLLDDDTVLLEYKLGETRSFLWLIKKNEIKIFSLPRSEEVEKLGRDFYNAVVAKGNIEESSAKLNQILFAPVAENIKNKRLAIIADGILQYVPFSALVKNETVVLPSASVLSELRQTISRPTIKTIGIFADPVFDANDARISTIAKNTKTPKPNEISKILRDFSFGDNLPRLLSSRFEANTISAFAPKNQTDVRIDFEANRENVLRQNLSDYRILHFATHGLLDSSRPEFSGLVFSLYDKDGKEQDGFLRLNQIYNLNLNSDLVVLSACQTALGKDVRGEGLIGLTRGFMYAGAKRVVASLWKVDDAATAEFMKRFYQNLLQKKLAPASALHSAQSEMKQIPRFKSPYFWAGFSLQGDWK